MSLIRFTQPVKYQDAPSGTYAYIATWGGVQIDTYDGSVCIPVAELLALATGFIDELEMFVEKKQGVTVEQIIRSMDAKFWEKRKEAKNHD